MARTYTFSRSLEPAWSDREDFLTDALPTLAVSSLTCAGLVARCPLFRGLEPAALQRLARGVTVREARRRQVLLSQGDPASACWIVSSGLVKVQHTTAAGDDVIVRLVGAGEPIAGIGPSGGSSHTVSATALEPTQLLVWNRSAIDAEIARHPVLACNAVRILGERLRRLEEDHALLATRKLEDRLALVLLRLADRHGRPTPHGTALGLTREELAQITGTNLFSVSRQLSQWEAQGIVRSRREIVVLREPDRLAGIASGGASLARVV